MGQRQNPGIGQGVTRARRRARNATLIDMSVASSTRHIPHVGLVRRFALSSAGRWRTQRKPTRDPLLQWAGLALAVGERASSAAVATVHSEVAPALRDRLGAAPAGSVW